MRNLAEYIAEYENTYDDNDKLYCSDFQQIMDISVKQLKPEQDIGAGLAWNLIRNALMAGYMIGYKKAKENN